MTVISLRVQLPLISKLHDSVPKYLPRYMIIKVSSGKIDSVDSIFKEARKGLCALFVMLKKMYL
jgi:hypothetical protein